MLWPTLHLRWQRLPPAAQQNSGPHVRIICIGFWHKASYRAGDLKLSANTQCSLYIIIAYQVYFSTFHIIGDMKHQRPQNCKMVCPKSSKRLITPNGGANLYWNNGNADIDVILRHSFWNSILCTPEGTNKWCNYSSRSRTISPIIFYQPSRWFMPRWICFDSTFDDANWKRLRVRTLQPPGNLSGYKTIPLAVHFRIQSTCPNTRQHVYTWEQYPRITKTGSQTLGARRCGLVLTIYHVSGCSHMRTVAHCQVSILKDCPGGKHNIEDSRASLLLFETSAELQESYTLSSAKPAENYG